MSNNYIGKFLIQKVYLLCFYRNRDYFNPVRSLEGEVIFVLKELKDNANFAASYLLLTSKGMLRCNCSSLDNFKTWFKEI